MATKQGQKPEDELYDDAEIVRRRDEALRRALNTPPQPHKTDKPKTPRKRGTGGDTSGGKRAPSA